MRSSPWLALLFLLGCYSYRPLEVPEPAPGANVRVALTDEGSQRLAPDLGADIVRVEGKVLQADSSGVSLSLTEVENAHREPTYWNGESVKLPHVYLQRIEQRRISAGGTGLLGGAFAAGLVAAYAMIGQQSTAVGSVGAPGGRPH
jgi:hypothetical protein